MNIAILTGNLGRDPELRQHNGDNILNFAIGVAIGEIFYVKDLAADCAEDGVYEFFFTAPPLHIPGAAGSPINPQAIK
jgi:hypothetical protein